MSITFDTKKNAGGYQTKLLVDGKDKTAVPHCRPGAAAAPAPGAAAPPRGRYVCDQGAEYGSFEIDGPGFDTGETMSMSISIHESQLGKGYAKNLIRETCEFIKMEEFGKIRKDQLLFIDTDASLGFWQYIGMSPNKYYETSGRNRDLEGKGYELGITFSELCLWAGVATDTLVGGNKRRTTKRKSRKSRGNKRRNKKHKSKNRRTLH